MSANRIPGVIITAALLLGIIVPSLFNPGPAAAEIENPYLVSTFVDEDGERIDVIDFPGRPPEIKAAAAVVPESRVQMGISVLGEVPTFDWSYGCSATSAAMLFGYYDRTGYRDMYTGPTSGGVCPLYNYIWGPGIGGSPGECPLSATHDGIDGRTTRGHVDDYWIEYLDPGPDPWIVNGWIEHTPEGCTGDFMGTNQSAFGNPDGSTIFGFYEDGKPFFDPDLSPYGMRDGCHGLRLFAESRGYSVVTNFNQYIYGYQGNTQGFTFSDFMAEIDAGRPVLIQVEGHTMLGYGYDTTGSVVYIHDTWDYSSHAMTWGGSYSGRQHVAVSVIRLAEVAPSLTTANASGITDSSATLNANLSDLGTAPIVTVSFEWGETTAYGSETTPEVRDTTGLVSFGLPGLSHNTTYHYRAKAVGDGTSYGGDKSFTTEPTTNHPPDAPLSPLCQGETNPTGVTDPTPGFSWTFSDPDEGDTQGAYRILVASSLASLAAGNGDMWDSGKIGSGAGEASYAGTTLAQSRTYYWKVKTWDNHDAGGPYCSQQQFTMGATTGHVWAFSAAGFFPRHLPDAYTGEVVLADLSLDDIPDEVQGVWWWNGAEWVFWVPGVGGELITLKGGLEADYSVLVSGPGDWTVPLP